MRSLGQQLLKRLLGRPSPAQQDELPQTPAPDELADLAAAAVSGRTEASERLAFALLAIDRDGPAELQAAAIGVLEDADPRVWTNLDLAARRSWWHAPAWSRAVMPLLAEGEPGTLTLVIASCHHDGYFRQAAVARLAELDGGVAVPALALRAADWVNEVRSRARLALEQHLERSPATTIGRATPVALALGDRERGRWLTERLREVLRNADDDVLSATRAASDWRTRREGYAASIDRQVLPVDLLISAAEKDYDLPIRRMCARAAVAAAVSAGRQDALRPLLQSGTAVVRAEVLHALGDQPAAQAALADDNPLVRAVAQAILRRGGRDLRSLYVDLLSAEPIAAGAVAGIGEVGRPEDSGLLVPLLSVGSPRVRAEAVRALRRLGQATPDLLFPMLRDDSGRVVRQVVAALRPNVTSLELPALRELLGAGYLQHTRTAAYKLLRERGAYVRLAVDLQLLNDASPELAGRAKADVHDWLTRVGPTAYEPPSGSIRDELDQRVTEQRSVLGASTTRALRFHLRLT
jgi:hypothetical protein